MGTGAISNAVGKYVSDNSRNSAWGQGAIRQISENLQRELPGLRGFSEAAIKKMRLFYESWQPIFINRSLSMNDLTLTQNQISNQAENGKILVALPHSDEITLDLNLLLRHLSGFTISDFPINEFLRVGFTHHSEILAKEKSLNGRLFYISRCAVEFLSVEALKSNLRGNLYAKLGTLPNNFLQTL
ncbi:MAG: DUF1016 N-terminal domain-containing protein, partial [Chitinispirillia bacterium]|nr:DUF1016 N-terminal domain-containing protein [Chitinispirillia bacterium]